MAVGIKHRSGPLSHYYLRDTPQRSYHHTSLPDRSAPRIASRNKTRSFAQHKIPVRDVDTQRLKNMLDANFQRQYRIEMQLNMLTIFAPRTLSDKELAGIRRSS
ncbi:hypothetical protein GQ53DRAFT_14691 [Thozetella sp. PMI_491]|nr:hypothetical protein GQ53DRAFT_14691 [Thozetella sp. PMI_491]